MRLAIALLSGIITTIIASPATKPTCTCWYRTTNVMIICSGSIHRSWKLLITSPTLSTSTCTRVTSLASVSPRVVVA